MAFTIYAKMKRVGKQKKEDLLPVPFELEKRPDTVREACDGSGTAVRIGI